MRCLLLFFILVQMTIFALPSKAQGHATLVLHHADGTTTDVQLYTQPQVRFEGDRVLITSTVLDMDYAKEDVITFTYKGNGTGIGIPKAEADYSQEGDCMVFHGIASTSKVAVYNSNGIRVPARLSAAGDDVTLSLSSIPQGVYILSVNGKTSKFMKR